MPTKPKNKGGRPKLEIDYKLVKKLASIHCTQEEISNVLEISTRTLQRDEEFCRIYKIEISKAKSSLRRYQWSAAEKGNTGMLVWLGKQYLQQREPEQAKQELPELPDFDNLTDEQLDAFIKRHSN